VNRSRLEAFSDGVFAVAITLLALDLAVKGPANGDLASLLVRPASPVLDCAENLPLPRSMSTAGVPHG